MNAATSLSLLVTVRTRATIFSHLPALRLSTLLLVNTCLVTVAVLPVSIHSNTNIVIRFYRVIKFISIIYQINELFKTVIFSLATINVKAGT